MKKTAFSIPCSVSSAVKRGALSHLSMANGARCSLSLGRNDAIAFIAVVTGDHVSPGDAALAAELTYSLDGEPRSGLANIPPLLGGEGRGEGELVSPTESFRLGERARARGNGSSQCACSGSGEGRGIQHPASRIHRSAFSLIEILVAVALMSFIVLGLLITFNHVSRVFRSGMGQVDFLAAGRTVTENIMRELEQITPSSAPYTINFLADQPRVTPAPSLFAQPLVQALPGTTSQRVNSIQELFFLARFNQDWIATGYKVLPNPGSDCVGSLYRYTATNRYNLPLLTTAFLAAQKTNLSLVADGIVNFRITTFATNGFRILPNPGLPAKTNAVFLVQRDPNLLPFGPYAINSSTAYWSGSVPDQVDYYFLSNAVPAYVELEIGILEPATLERYRSIGNAAAARDYLSNHVAQVHLFRQRASIRNVDYSAYVSQ